MPLDLQRRVDGVQLDQEVRQGLPLVDTRLGGADLALVVTDPVLLGHLWRWAGGQQELREN